MPEAKPRNHGTGASMKYMIDAIKTVINDNFWFGLAYGIMACGHWEIALVIFALLFLYYQGTS
jgi:hypothetical protein